jgi:hypothetical protein
MGSGWEGKMCVRLCGRIVVVHGISLNREDGRGVRTRSCMQGHWGQACQQDAGLDHQYLLRM